MPLQQDGASTETIQQPRMGHLDPVKNLKRIIESHNRERLAVMATVGRNRQNIAISQQTIDEIRVRADDNNNEMDPADAADLKSHEKKIVRLEVLNENSEARCRELITLMDSDGDMLIEVRPMTEKEQVAGRKSKKRYLEVSMEQRKAVGATVVVKKTMRRTLTVRRKEPAAGKGSIPSGGGISDAPEPVRD
jgi:hypothetical protein